MKINLDILKSICPQLNKNADAFLPYLNEYLPKYGIVSERQIAGFLAQAAHETGQFKYTREIASGEAYEGRKDLGNLYKGDGVKFKGRGIFQTTGRANYAALSKKLGVDFVSHPDMLQTPQYAVLSACIFWQDIKGNGLMSLPETWRSATKKYDPFQYLTFRIQGGQLHLVERLAFFNRAIQALSYS